MGSEMCIRDRLFIKQNLVVELDNSSHQRADRQARDQLVDAAFAAAKFPILHVPCCREYHSEDLKQQIRAALSPAPPVPIETDASHAPNVALMNQLEASSAPICPKCNIPMVQRTASRGKQRGRRFWGCPSYPDCRNIIAID